MQRKPDITEAKILIVDDNTFLQEKAKLEFRKLGIDYKSKKITTANDGQAAVDLANKESFDIIYMDGDMPVMKGLEAALKIRELEKKTGKRSIIFLASVNDDLVKTIKQRSDNPFDFIVDGKNFIGQLKEHIKDKFEYTQKTLSTSAPTTTSTSSSTVDVQPTSMLAVDTSPAKVTVSITGSKSITTSAPTTTSTFSSTTGVFSSLAAQPTTVLSDVGTSPKASDESIVPDESSESKKTDRTKERSTLRLPTTTRRPNSNSRSNSKSTSNDELRLTLPEVAKPKPTNFVRNCLYAGLLFSVGVSAGYIFVAPLLNPSNESDQNVKPPGADGPK